MAGEAVGLELVISQSLQVRKLGSTVAAENSRMTTGDVTGQLCLRDVGMATTLALASEGVNLRCVLRSGFR